MNKIWEIVVAIYLFVYLLKLWITLWPRQSRKVIPVVIKFLKDAVITCCDSYNKWKL